MLKQILVLRLNRLTHVPPALNATQLLVESGFSVVVLEFGEGYKQIYSQGEFALLEWKFSWIRFLPRPMRAVSVFVFVAMRLIIKIGLKERPTLIVANGLQEQWIAYCVGLLFRIPYVVHVHEIFDPKDVGLINRMFLSLEGMCLRNAQFLIFPGEERRSIYTGRYRLWQPSYVVWNCPRLRKECGSTRTRDQLKLKEHEKLLVYLGGVGEENAILESVIAVSKIPELHFAIAGWVEPTYQDEIRNASKRFGVEGRIHLMGPVKDEKWDLLESADASLCVYKPLNLRMTCNATPSNKLMESIAAGTPVVGGITRDFKEFFSKYPVGVYVESTEPSVLVEAINQTIRNSSAMGNLALQLHKAELHYERQFQPVMKMMDNYRANK